MKENYGASVPGGTINNIQAMRGIASLSVFMGHALLLMAGIGLDRYFSFFGVVASSGVDIFFVISGFIISTVAVKSGQADQSRVRCAWNFGIKRVVRIYPVYWIVFLFAFLLSGWVNFAPPVTDIKPLIQQFLLFTHVNSYIMAAWSLAFEIYFYAVVVTCLLISPRHVGKILALWAVVVIAVIAYDYFIGHRGWIGLLPLSPLILEFIMGMVVACLIHCGLSGFAMTSAFVGVVSFIVGSEVMRSMGWSTLNPWYRTFYNGLPSAFIIYAVVALEYRRVWVFSKGWVKLGDASYSLYIWHQFIFYGILTVISGKAWVAGVPALVLIWIWLIPAFAFGIFSFKYIELPLQRLLNRALLIDTRGVGGGTSLLKRAAYIMGAAGLVGGVYAYSLFERARLESAADTASSVANAVVGGSSSVPFDLEAAGIKAGLITHPAIRGNFDGVYEQPGIIRVHGWAADISAGNNDVSVLVFHCGRYLGVAPRGESRSDVAKALQISDGNSGFTTNLAETSACASKRVDGLILGTGSRFAVISAELE